jgi:hypothetical protein
MNRDDGRVPTFEELDQLSSRELHDRAVARAKRHLDVRFFWDLLQITPAAEVSAGDVREAEEDVAHWSLQVHNAVKDEPEDAVDGRRAFYLDYLMRH